MVKEKVLVKNPIGVHLRPAGDIAEAAIKYKKCEIYLSSRGRNVNRKRLMSILSLRIKQNKEFQNICDGEDEEAALKSILAALGPDL